MIRRPCDGLHTEGFLRLHLPICTVARSKRNKVVRASLSAHTIPTPHTTAAPLRYDKGALARSDATTICARGTENSVVSCSVCGCALALYPSKICKNSSRFWYIAKPCHKSLCEFCHKALTQILHEFRPNPTRISPQKNTNPTGAPI